MSYGVIQEYYSEPDNWRIQGSRNITGSKDTYSHVADPL